MIDAKTFYLPASTDDPKRRASWAASATWMPSGGKIEHCGAHRPTRAEAVERVCAQAAALGWPAVVPGAFRHVGGGAVSESNVVRGYSVDLVDTLTGGTQS